GAWRGPRGGGETVASERTSVPSRSVATSRGAFERLIMRPPWLPSVDPPSPLACHAGSEPSPQHSRDAVFPNGGGHFVCGGAHLGGGLDRKSTRLNSSHVKISYAVFC